MGLSMHGFNTTKQFRPIWEKMYLQQIISKLMFTMCLGINGGYVQLGGFSLDNHLESIKWTDMVPNPSKYHLNLQGYKVSNITLKGLGQWKLGLVDSGTTFTYLPS